MATYAVGDVQGCYRELATLLDRVNFDSSRDRLWLVGDIINRGPQSLATLRLVRSLGASAITVFGNHELHLLAIRYGGHTVKRADTFTDILEAPDADELCDWLRQLPFLHLDASLGYVMTHAGIPHLWDLDEAGARAREVEAVIRGAGHPRYFQAMYGNQPDCWDPALEGMDRWRVITNYFTRMRLVDRAGRLEFAFKGDAPAAPGPWQPWYRLRAERPLPLRVLFGHWATLRGITGDDRAIALDTGCVYGDHLTALHLETGEFLRIEAQEN